VPRPLVLITGFGPFPDDANNPSRLVAAALQRHPPRGVRVRACELPVTFDGAPIAVARFVERFAHKQPALLLGLGVQRDGYFRFERRARGRFDARRADNAGRTGAAIDLGAELVTRVDVRELAELLRVAGANDVRVSNDAGRYVCERTYRALLEHGRELGIPAVFLHVPPAKSVAPAEQARLVRAMLALLFSSPARSRAALHAKSATKPRKRGTRARTRARQAP
jgi:pyroglutamyl-peptidase